MNVSPSREDLKSVIRDLLDAAGENSIIFPLHFFALDKAQHLELEKASIKYLKLPFVPLVRAKDEMEIRFYPWHFWLSCKLSSNENPRPTFDKALAIVNLWSSHFFTPNYYFYSNKNEVSSHLLAHYRQWNRKQSLYCLPSCDFETFKSHWRHHRSIDNDSFAVDRYNQACQQPYDRDLIRNYVEVLEYLFVPDAKEGSITEKFCTRPLILFFRNLSSEKEDKKRIYTCFKKAYNYRSRVTHGGNLPEFCTATMIDFLENVARNAIRFFHAHGVLDQNKNEEREKIIRRFTTLGV